MFCVLKISKIAQKSTNMNKLMTTADISIQGDFVTFSIGRYLWKQMQVWGSFKMILRLDYQA